MIWTSRFLFLDTHATTGSDICDQVAFHCLDTVYATGARPEGWMSNAIFVAGKGHEHLLEAEAYFSKFGKSIADFEKIFVLMRNPYDLELSRYQWLAGSHGDGPARVIAKKGEFSDFLKYAPLHGQLPPRLDRYFEVFGSTLQNLVILKFESFAQDVRSHLAPYLADVDWIAGHGAKSLRFDHLYDAETEKLCYRRNRWFFDSGHYPRLEVPTSRRSICIDPISIIAATSDASAPIEVETIAPVVSIMIVFRNNAEFFRDALESVYRQTFTDWQLLLVDDGSTDGSGKMADTLALFDGRVHCLRHEGSASAGFAASRRLADSQARGEFVAVLGPDDVYASENAIAEQVALMRENPQVAFVFGAFELWESWNGGGDVIQVPFAVDKVISPPRLVPRMFEHWKNEPHSRMERRSAVSDVGGCAPDFQSPDADFTLWISLASRFPVFSSSQCWYRLRMHSQSRFHGMVGRWRPLLEKSRLYAWADRQVGQAPELGPLVRIMVSLRLWRTRLLRTNLWRIRAALWARSKFLHWRDMALQNGRWLQLSIRSKMLRVARRLGNMPGGDLEINPGVALLEAGDRYRPPTSSVTVSWNVRGTDLVDIRVGSEDGSFFVKGTGPSGSRSTGEWVRDWTWFFLQDAGAANPGSKAATLDIVQARVRYR